MDERETNLVVSLLDHYERAAYTSHETRDLRDGFCRLLRALLPDDIRAEREEQALAAAAPGIRVAGVARPVPGVAAAAGALELDEDGGIRAGSYTAQGGCKVVITSPGRPPPPPSSELAAAPPAPASPRDASIAHRPLELDHE